MLSIDLLFYAIARFSLLAFCLLGVTNEHSALTVQFPGKPASTIRSYTFPTIEADMLDIKVVRYEAPILLVKVVDETANKVEGAKITADFDDRPHVSNTFGFGFSFSTQTVGIYRSESLCPDKEFTVLARKDGMESDRVKMMMKEGSTDEITLTLKPVKEESSKKK